MDGQKINNNEEEKIFSIIDYEENKNTNNSKNINNKKVTFKENNNEIENEYLFPFSAGNFLPKKHLAILIHEIVERLNIKELENIHKRERLSEYHPKMLLKVWILGFAYGIYTSRKLEQAIRENLAFIWISGQNKPDFRTLNKFRLRFKDKIKELFREIIINSINFGVIKLEDILNYHTEMEIYANKQKIVWKKIVDNKLNKIEIDFDALFECIDRLNIEEDNMYGDRSIIEEFILDEEKFDEYVNLIIENKTRKRK